MRDFFIKRRRHARHLRLLPPLFLAVLIIAGACDFQLLEPPEIPRWGFSLTIPLINKTYELSELADNDTTISEDTTTNELRIEFSGALDTTSIDSSFLEVELPASATSRFILETVGGINASDLTDLPLEENVEIVVRLDTLIRKSALSVFFPDISFPSADPVTIPQDDWNTYVATLTIDSSGGPFQVIDTSTAFEDIPFIERMRYLRLDATPGSSEFHTTVYNNGFPTSIDSICLSLSSGDLLSVIHDNDGESLAKDETYDESTDLAAEKLGSEMDFELSMRLPEAVGDVVVEAGDSAKVAINISIIIGGVDSLAVTTAETSLLSEAPDPLPLPGDIAISNGVLRTSPPSSETNKVALQSLVNTMPFDIDFALIFPNISPTGTDSLTFGPYTLSSGEVPINETKDMSGYTFRNPAGSGAIEEFEYEVQADIVPGNVSLPLDGSPLGSFQVGIEFGDGNGNGKGDLYFDSMTGDFSISFDAVNTTIQNIPTGFAGFQLGRLSLGLLLRNQIKLPVQLDLRLVGRRISEHDSVVVPINAYVNYPDPSGTAPDDITPIPSGNGDTAYTLIVLDENSVRTYWLYEGETDTSGAWWSTSTTAGDQTIVDVLNLPPDVIEVAGAAVIKGEGVVQAGKGIWGEFEMIAPFAFLLPQDISFLPVAPIALAPMDETTRHRIQTALLSASLTSQARTNFPFGGKISMLASDTTLFTLALDDLDDIAAGFPTAARTGDTTVYATIEEVLEADSIMGVDRIVFYPEEAVVSPLETKARRVEFYTTTGDSFWIGRLFDMELPAPREVNELGYVTIPGDTSQNIALDAERVGWIASDTTVYLKSFFTLYGVSGVRTIQSSNWVQFAAYITFDLASDVLGASEEETESSQVEVAAIANMTLVTDSTASVYLDLVFTPPEGTEVRDLELIATTSHAGIATATIRTERTGGTARKVLRVTAVGLGTARIEVSADDNPQDDIDPVTTSFLVTVEQADGESAPPMPLSIQSLTENGQR